MCTVKGSLRSWAAARLARNRSAVQVSICIGETTPDRRPQGCWTAASMSFSAASKRSLPACSSQLYLSSKSFSSFQRPEA